MRNDKQLKPVPLRHTLKQHVTENLREAVISGAFPPGSQLVESQLAEQLGVSRAPLREAIRELTEEGLLQREPFVGTFVTRLTNQDIEEIYSLRTAFEIFTFEYIWDRRRDDFYGEMDARHEDLLQAIDREDPDQSVTAELALHSLVYEYSDHRLLLVFWRSLKSRLHHYLAVHQRAHGRKGPVRDAHINYVQLAKGDDLVSMRQEVQHHMQRGLDRVKAFLEQTSEDES